MVPAFFKLHFEIFTFCFFSLVPALCATTSLPFPILAICVTLCPPPTISPHDLFSETGPSARDDMRCFLSLFTPPSMLLFDSPLLSFPPRYWSRHIPSAQTPLPLKQIFLLLQIQTRDPFPSVAAGRAASTLSPLHFIFENGPPQHSLSSCRKPIEVFCPTPPVIDPDPVLFHPIF